MTAGIYADVGSYLRRRYDRLLTKHRQWPLPGRRTAYTMRLRNASAPFVCRYESTDFPTLREIFIDREYDAALEHIPADCKLILDLGANAGYSVRLWLERFVECRVIAAEPDCQNAAILRCNMQLANASERVKLREVCVVGAARSVQLDRSGGDWGVRIAPANDGQLAVPGITVADLLAENGNPQVDLAKCDIEGAEAEVFSDCSAWIHRLRYLIIEVHPPYSGARLLADLTKAGVKPRVLYRRDKGYGLEVLALAL
ncbi:MAG: FkbM family methyltransferase [Phycisphaerales bacterium]|nr:FkbM family methyltransferase [Phycisphaerales bacterium]